MLEYLFLVRRNDSIQLPELRKKIRRTQGHAQCQLLAYLGDLERGPNRTNRTNEGHIIFTFVAQCTLYLRRP